MTKTVAPAVRLNPISLPARLSRLVTFVLILSSLVACAVAPTQTAVSEPAEPTVSVGGVAAAVEMYKSRDYPAAIEAFDKVIADMGSSASDLRLAHLGKAMVYLGNDESLHSVENAKMSLISAGQVSVGDDGVFSAETDLLMDAVSGVIGTESKYVALQSKSGDSGAEIERLKRENAALEEQRDELLEEQKALNEAIEKLKQLTLGN